MPSYAFSLAFAPAFDGLINLVVPDPFPDLTEPLINLSVVSDINGETLRVTNILRYNGHGRWTCNLLSDAGVPACMDVYIKDNIEWRAKRYIPERYRDEDGVLKGL